MRENRGNERESSAWGGRKTEQKGQGKLGTWVMGFLAVIFLVDENTLSYQGFEASG